MEFIGKFYCGSERTKLNVIYESKTHPGMAYLYEMFRINAKNKAYFRCSGCQKQYHIDKKMGNKTFAPENLPGFINFEEKIVKFYQNPDLKRHEKCWKKNLFTVKGATKFRDGQNKYFEVKNDGKILVENQNSKKLLKNIDKNDSVKSVENHCFQNSLSLVKDKNLQKSSPETATINQQNFIQIPQFVPTSSSQMPQFYHQQQQENCIQTNEFNILLPDFLHQECYYFPDENY